MGSPTHGWEKCIEWTVSLPKSLIWWIFFSWKTEYKFSINNWMRKVWWRYMVAFFNFAPGYNWTKSMMQLKPMFHLSHEDLSSLDEHWGAADIKPLLQTLQTELLHFLVAALHLDWMEGQHGELLHVLMKQESETEKFTSNKHTTAESVDSFFFLLYSKLCRPTDLQAY